VSPGEDGSDRAGTGASGEAHLPAGRWPVPAPTVALVGPTAAGKSHIALEVAEAASRAGEDPVELVSVDSMAVYRGMDLGTAKPTPEQQGQVPYHLLDLVDPSKEFTVQQFQAAARHALDGIAGRGHPALLVGGTGLYLRSIVDDLHFPGRFPEVAASLAATVDAGGPEGSAGSLAALASLHQRLADLDPVGAGRVAPTNRRRLLRALEVTLGSGRPFSSFGPGLERYPPTPVAMVGIDLDPGVLDARIADRFDRLMELGLLEEVRALAARPGGLSRTARQALGYRELLDHLETGLPVATAVEQAVQRTRSLARRQRSWFRRDPRIVWLEPDDDPVEAIRARVGGVRAGGAPVGDWPARR
jgi:tRNA dimethylallyltransferase